MKGMDPKTFVRLVGKEEATKFSNNLAKFLLEPAPKKAETPKEKPAPGAEKSPEKKPAHGAEKSPEEKPAEEKPAEEKEE